MIHAYSESRLYIIAIFIIVLSREMFHFPESGLLYP